MRLERIRAGRARPGLGAQHLAAVRAAAAAGDAAVEGDVVGSQELRFAPRGLRGGRFHFEIGTAGATSLVLQTVALPLARAGPTSLTLGGGTHVPWSPCFHYLALHWLPCLRALDLDAEVTLERAGFHPRGGGRLHAELWPLGRLVPLERTERGALRRVTVLSVSARLPDHVATRQAERARARLAECGAELADETLRLSAPSPGSMLLLLAEFEKSRCCTFGLGARGKPAERVADEAVDALEAFLATSGAVDPYLADQLLVPLAFAAGRSQITTSRVTGHLRTNAAVVGSFLGPVVEIDGALEQPGRVCIQGVGLPAATR